MTWLYLIAGLLIGGVVGLHFGLVRAQRFRDEMLTAQRQSPFPLSCPVCQSPEKWDHMPHAPFCYKERDNHLETIRRLTKENTRLLDALTWRPAAVGEALDAGAYLCRVGRNASSVEVWVIHHSGGRLRTAYLTHIAGPLPLREGGRRG